MVNFSRINTNPIGTSGLLGLLGQSGLLRLLGSLGLFVIVRVIGIIGVYSSQLLHDGY